MHKTDSQNLPLLIVRATGLFWILTKFLCFKLWHTDRLFPVCPAFSFLENCPYNIHLLLFAIAVCGMGLLVIFPRDKRLMACVLLVELCSCLLDQNRLQPWEYQYLLTFLFAFLYRGNTAQFLNYFGFLLAATYINSGLHKLSGGFLYHGWDKIVLHNIMGLGLETIRIKWLHYSGLLVGLLEALAGFGLLFSRYRSKCAQLLIAMHVLILLFLSPTGIDYNFIIWPWNSIMIVFLYFLFLKPQPDFISIRNLIKFPHTPLFVLIGILPLFCFIGYFDSFLSFNLYSGTSANMEICIKNQSQAKPYRHLLTNRQQFCNGAKAIDVTQWSLRELHVPVYPEKRVYLDIITKFKTANPSTNATFIIYQYPYQPNDVREYR